MEKLVVDFLRPELATCQTVAEVLTVVRATQAAAHRCGWVLNAEPTPLIVTAEGACQAAVHAPATWQVLRAYREPYRGAAFALAALELAPKDMLILSCGDISADGSTVNFAGTALTVPAGGQVYLRAQTTLRQFGGAGPADPLFADGDGKPVRQRSLSDALWACIRELGLPAR